MATILYSWLMEHSIDEKIACSVNFSCFNNSTLDYRLMASSQLVIVTLAFLAKICKCIIYFRTVSCNFLLMYIHVYQNKKTTYRRQIKNIRTINSVKLNYVILFWSSIKKYHPVFLCNFFIQLNVTYHLRYTCIS